MNRIIVAIFVQAWCLAGATQAPEPPLPEQELFRLVNLERTNAGLDTLQWDAKLALAAQAHARELAGHAALSHRFSGEPELTQRVSAAGARFSAAAENVALADTPEEIHLALMNSPGHRANIMSPRYNAVGIGVVVLRNRMYVAQDFAHVVPVYSDEQFRKELLAAFNRARRAHRFPPIDSRSDPRLDREACSGKLDATGVLSGQAGATHATIFTSSQPDDLPSTMQSAAGDPTLRRMSIGVCYRADPRDKFSQFWVVVTFNASR
jgi:Cysteine-rich secretory protein family